MNVISIVLDQTKRLHLSRVGLLPRRLGAALRSEWLLAAIALQALLLRSYLAWWHRAAAPGDTYNYMFMAQAFLDGRYPSGDKRLPLYPFFMALGWGAGLDPVDWGIALSVLASTGTVLLTYFLARALGLGGPAGYLAALIVSFDRFLLGESARPLTESLFTFLLVAAFLAYLRAETRRGWIALGALLGLASLTRWEGFIAGALLLGALTVRRNVAAILTTSLTYGVLVSPIFVSNAVAFGNPFHLQYLTGARSGGESYIVQSPAELRANLSQIWWDQAGTQAGLLKDRSRKVAEIIRTRNTGEGLELLRDRKHNLELGAALLRIVLGAGGLALFLVRTRWRGAPIVAFVLLQILLVAWWTPLSRFFSMTAPFVALWMGTALGALIPRVDGRAVGRAAATAALLILVAVSLLAGHSWRFLGERVRDGQYSDYAMFQAVRYLLRQTEGVVVFSEENLAARAYFEHRDRQRLAFGTESLQTSAEEQHWWIHHVNAAYVLRYDKDPAPITVLDDPAYRDHFPLVKRFEYARPGYQDRGPALFWAEIYEVR